MSEFTSFVIFFSLIQPRSVYPQQNQYEIKNNRLTFNLNNGNTKIHV